MALLGRVREGENKRERRWERLGIKGRTQSDSVRNRDRKGRRQRKIY